MIAPSRRKAADRLQELHCGPRILLLPNAWDAASARIFETAGFAAIATSSAAVAFALGFPDGERVPFPEVLRTIERIAGAVGVPVSADFEAGFAETPRDVGRNCLRVIEAGAVGINLEDGTGNGERPLLDTSLHCDKIRAAAEAAASAGTAFVINARTDVYLDSVGEPGSRFDEAVRRCNAYRAAGAGCLFVPGVTDGETIGRLARAIEGPLNVLAGKETPAVAELERLGVARLSLGSGPMRATLGLLRKIGGELLGTGTYQSLFGDAIPYAEANRLFEKP